LGDHGSHIAADAITGDCKPCAIETKLVTVFSNVFRGCKSLLDWNRELGLGRRCVVHKHEGSICAIDQITQQTVMGVLAAQHPSTTVVVHHDGQTTV
jgi:hypothetical protein